MKTTINLSRADMDVLAKAGRTLLLNGYVLLTDQSAEGRRVQRVIHKMLRNEPVTKRKKI